MTDQPIAGPGGVEDDDAARPRFTDKRRIDPETGELRQPSAEEGQAAAEPADGAPAVDQDALAAAEALAAERLEDLKRLQAEYVNYRRRVERDRDVARENAIVDVAEALMSTLDDIELARQHGELEDGPFASIAEKLEATLARFGWERYGAPGEPFDPNVHEALMHQHSDDVTETTVVQVLQPGYRVNERIVRAARVAVADPPA